MAEHPWAGLLAASSFAAVLLLALRSQSSVPALKPANAPASEFSEARAVRHTAEIVACGIRTVGSYANEHCAAEAVRRELRELKQLAAARGRTLELALQRPSGAFFIDFIGGLTNTYTNVTNVVARLKGSGTESEGPGWCESPRALLVSSHFDSALGSYAASDATGNVGMMLEMLRALLHRPTLPVDVLWNFNGGEETIMQAAHGFAVAHPWVKHACAVVNLEAIGVGGRELLFQAGPRHGWIVEAYAAAAPRPHGSSVVQAIFSSGVIPGDTDYRVYRDFGGVPGIDFAVIGNGWVYHTREDAMPALRASSGTLQRYGENILALACELATRIPHVGMEDGDRAVHFFDVLGVAMVVYDMALGRALHLAVLAVAGSALFWASARGQLSIRCVAVATFAVLAGFLIALGVGAGIGGLLSLTGSCMVWYSRPLLLAPLMAAPILACSLEWYRRALCCFSQAEVQAGAAAIPAVVLLVTIALDSPIVSPVAYLPLVWLVSPLLASLAGQCAPRTCIAGLVLPWLCSLQLILLAVEVLVPLAGRSGDTLPGDLIIGAALGGGLGIVVSHSAPLIALIPRGHVLAAERAMLVAALFAAVLALGVPAALPPYDAEHPKRLFLQHVSQTFHEVNATKPLGAALHRNDSVWLMPFDWRCLAPVSGFDFWAAERSVGPPLEHWPATYAQLPYFLPIHHMLSPACGGLLAAPPVEPSEPLTVSLSWEQAPSRPLRLHVAMRTGGPQMAAVVPARGLKGWSLGSILPKARSDCDCHWVLHANGGEPDPPVREWSFWLDVDRYEAAGHDYALELYAHWMENYTAELERLMSELPRFVTPVAWSSLWMSLWIKW